MFNIGMSEFIVIGALALIFIGPKQLPEMARMVGRLINELKRAGEEVFGSMNDVRNSARRFVEDTEKKIEDVAKPYEPVLHKGIYKTEEPEAQQEMNLVHAHAAEVVTEPKVETTTTEELVEIKTGTEDDKRGS
jgi:sec-independent protein translocase protein TatB